MKRKTAVILALIIAMSFSGCTLKSSSKEEAQSYSWTLATSSPEDTVTQLFARRFAEEVARLSAGAMEIKIFSNSVLGGDTELLESCSEGDIPFVIQNTAPQVTYVKEAAVFDMPAVFQSIEEVRAAVDSKGFYNEIQKGYEAAGYRLLAFADQEFRVMTTNKRIEALADFSGQKIRTMENANHISFWKSLGAKPTPMTFSEVYIGLQQNTIDAQENPYEVIVSSRLYDQQKYVIKTNHLPHLISLITNNDFYPGLSEEQRNIIDNAALVAREYAREQADLRVQDRISTMVDSGVEIIELPQETYESIKEKSQRLYESIEQQVGRDLVRAYVGALE